MIDFWLPAQLGANTPRIEGISGTHKGNVAAVEERGPISQRPRDPLDRPGETVSGIIRDGHEDRFHP